VARQQHLRKTQPPEAPGGLLADVAGARSAAEISDDLLLALLDFREAQAEVILSEAFALHPVEMVAEEIIAPTLVEVGKRWHRGDASVVQEHFATAFLRRRFIALFQAYGQSEQGLLAITGSAPGEWHDMGILLVSLALRRQGWRVIYLGQNVPAAELTAQIPFLRPALVCLSATMEQNAVGLCETVQAITALPEDVRPLLALGGRAFNENPALCEQFPNALMSPTARGLLSALPR
jgi:methanogenic corrinoid protein MtbC1